MALGDSVTRPAPSCRQTLDPDKRRRIFRTSSAGSTTYSLTPLRRPHWAKTVRRPVTLHAPHAAQIRPVRLMRPRAYRSRWGRQLLYHFPTEQLLKGAGARE